MATFNLQGATELNGQIVIEVLSKELLTVHKKRKKSVKKLLFPVPYLYPLEVLSLKAWYNFNI